MMLWRVFTMIPFHGSNISILVTRTMADPIDLKKIPEGLMFSSASAAYQIEGAWNLSGKGESIWDHITHTQPEYIRDMSNGDIACDSYHKYKEDVQLLKDTGFQMYRFSLSWPRILSNGLLHDGGINQDGVDYYHRLIDELHANNIEPMVTIYHWDLPQRLQELGGWTNPIMADYYAAYARLVFSLYGHKVKWWITINEPMIITTGYGSRDKAPAMDQHGIAEYLAGHNLLRAHAKAYRIYQQEFKQTQNGKLSVSVDGMFAMPLTDSAEDVEATERWNQFQFGWFLHPMLSAEGDYPPVMRSLVDSNSKLEGRSFSRLPYFTKEEILQLKGSVDFIGINHYSSGYVFAGTGQGRSPSWQKDVNVSVTVGEDWPRTASVWLRPFAPGFRMYLNWLKDHYGDLGIFVTESGVSDNTVYNDTARITYYQSYLEEMLKAIYLDKCNVIGYTAWSIMDNFEWTAGYTERFGLYYVDFTSPDRPRTAKASVGFFKQLLASRRLPS